MALADPGSFTRGLVYASSGRVERLTTVDGRSVATVRGSMPYEVRLWVDGAEPAWSCTCPVADDGIFCKHCVAVAVSREPGMLDAMFDPEETDTDAGGGEPGDGAALRDHVLGLDAERLAELVLEQAHSDWRLRERLGVQVRADR